MNFQAADPYGAYEWSTRITVRGFNQNQLGFTLDGVPLGDMTYGNTTVCTSAARFRPRTSRACRCRGTGSLDTASTSNLGGAVQFFSANPESEMGIRAEQMFGSDSARHTFVRVDTGEFGSGTRGGLEQLGVRRRLRGEFEHAAPRPHER